MKQRERTSLKPAKAVWDLAETGFEVLDGLGELAEHPLVGLVAFVVMVVVVFLINDGRSTLRDW